MNEQKIIDAFSNSPYFWRSPKGISEETGITIDKVEDIINNWFVAGKLIQCPEEINMFQLAEESK